MSDNITTDAVAPTHMEVGHRLRNIPLPGWYVEDEFKVDDVHYYTGVIVGLRDTSGASHLALAPGSVAAILARLLEGPGKPQRCVRLDVDGPVLRVSVVGDGAAEGELK